MTKSELIKLLARRSHISHIDIDAAVRLMLEYMSQVLSEGQRIEIRDFGVFTRRHRPLRQSRNPKTGETVTVPDKYIPHFKLGRNLRQRVNDSNKK